MAISTVFVFFEGAHSPFYDSDIVVKLGRLVIAVRWRAEGRRIEPHQWHWQ
jgi:hypothetical protein